MHKSKENPNGTFSIGKTWYLDDLSAIESFTSPTANPTFQEYAGDVGFVITLGKPYYWQAQTDKEKKFFIASLIKIYGKYTGGRMPSLAGFEQRELDQVLGGAQAAPRRPPGQDRPPPPRPAPVIETAPSSGNASIASGYNGNLTPQAALPTNSFPDRTASRGPMPPNGTASPSRSVDSTREQFPSLRRLASNNQSQDSVATSMAARSEDAASLRPRSRNGPNGTSTYATSNYASPEPTPGPPPEEIPPERKRPPIDPLRPSPADRDLVPAPLISPGMRREPPSGPVPVPPRNIDRARKGSINRRNDTPPLGDSNGFSNDLNKFNGPTPIATPPAGTPVSLQSAVSPPPPDTLTELPADPEDNRPGLGPMIKSKKSRGDIAGALWKAASAASAFKPRPGGAAEKLRQVVQSKSIDGPDGITGVVPAPPRPVSAQKAPEPVVTPQSTPKPTDRSSTPVIPEVKVNGSAATSRPGSIQTSVQGKKLEDTTEVVEESRSVIAGNDAKYLSTLGVDPSILDTRTAEFSKWLDYFRWVPGEQMRSLNFDDMRVDIDRELNKAQAGGWLARFQEEDERVEGIKKGMDHAISECDELDNLLTLYSVELSVSGRAVVCWMRLTSGRLSLKTLPTSKPKGRVSRCRQPTRSCSRRRSNPCWRRAPLANRIWTPSGWRLSTAQRGLKRSRRRSSRCTRP